jgi:hypothetical protein
VVGTEVSRLLGAIDPRTLDTGRNGRAGPLASGLAGYDLTVNEEKTPPVEGDTEDDPRRHGESPTMPPGEDSGEERAEKVAGEGGDVSDEESYEGGLPA